MFITQSAQSNFFTYSLDLVSHSTGEFHLVDEVTSWLQDTSLMWTEIFLWSPHALYLVPHNSSLYVSRVIHKRRAGHAPVLSRNCLVILERLEILEIQLTPTHSPCGMIIMGWAPGHTTEHCWVNAAFYTKFNTLLTRIVLNNSICIH